MGKILLPGGRWNSQPQAPVPIDPKWINRGLKAFYVLNANLWSVNLVTGEIGGSIVGTAPSFFSHKIRTSGAAGAYINLTLGRFSGATPLTVIVGSAHISGTVDWSLLRRDSGNWTGIYQDAALTTKTANNSVFDGAITPASGISFGAISNKATALAGTNSLRGCTNGGAIAVDTTVTNPTGGLFTQAALGARVLNSVANPAVADFTHFGVFDGVLTDEELISLSLNPWQIFASQQQNIYVSVASGDVSVSVTGVSATGSVGTVTVSGGASTTVTGVSATGSVGTVTVTTGGSVDVNVTGVLATGSGGTVSVTAGASTTVTGVSATGSVGTVTVSTSGSANVSVNVTGVSATGIVGNAFVWGLIDTSQTPGWVLINSSQVPNWVQIPT